MYTYRQRRIATFLTSEVRVLNQETLLHFRHNGDRNENFLSQLWKWGSDDLLTTTAAGAAPRKFPNQF